MKLIAKLSKIVLAGMIVAGTALAAAPWDGTKGNITISTIGNSQLTIISVECSDPTATTFTVSLSWKAPSLNGSQVNVVVLTISRIEPSFNQPPEPAIAVFSIPESWGQSVVVGVPNRSDTQIFKAN